MRVAVSACFFEIMVAVLLPCIGLSNCAVQLCVDVALNSLGNGWLDCLYMHTLSLTMVCWFLVVNAVAPQAEIGEILSGSRSAAPNTAGCPRNSPVVCSREEHTQPRLEMAHTSRKPAGSRSPGLRRVTRCAACARKA
jgi:hypothetical protein